jgi:hypothetical protein
MRKEWCRFLFFTAVLVMFSACAVNTRESVKAQHALTTFFSELSNGNYDKVVQFYGGSYETLVSFNPDLESDNYVALWQNGCQINGLHCQPIRTITFNERTDTGVYIFTVEFDTPNGELFILEACCGEDPTNPPQFQFEYRVVKSGDGLYRVLDLPVYVP